MITKIIFYTLLTAFISVSCGKISTEMIKETVSMESMEKKKGVFMGIGSERVSGEAKIFFNEGKYTLKLENFSTTNGPDLKVYLSKASTPREFISLGDLKSTNGNQVYNINGIPYFSQYRYVLIHCQRYNHLFGSAELN